MKLLLFYLWKFTLIILIHYTTAEDISTIDRIYMGSITTLFLFHYTLCAQELYRIVKEKTEKKTDKKSKECIENNASTTKKSSEPQWRLVKI